MYAVAYINNSFSLPNNVSFFEYTTFIHLSVGGHVGFYIYGYYE